MVFLIRQASLSMLQWEQRCSCKVVRTHANSLCGQMTDFMNVKSSSTLGCKVLMLSSVHKQQYTFPILERKKKSLSLALIPNICQIMVLKDKTDKISSLFWHRTHLFLYQLLNTFFSLNILYISAHTWQNKERMELFFHYNFEN
jgi:hypothetical protein